MDTALVNSLTIWSGSKSCFSTSIVIDIKKKKKKQQKLEISELENQWGKSAHKKTPQEFKFHPFTLLSYRTMLKINNSVDIFDT